MDTLISNKEFNNYFVDKTIALIGNSAGLLNSKQGEFIDSHDIVIRFNWGLPSGFEEYVGTRTDIWSTILWGSANQKEKQKKIFMLHKSFRCRKYTLWPFYFTKHIPDFIRHYYLYILPAEIYYNAYQEFNPEEEVDKKELLKPRLLHKKPTSGSVMLYYLTNYIKYKNISVFGVDCLVNKKNFYTHKYQDRTPHDQQKEENFVRKIIRKAENIEWII